MKKKVLFVATVLRGHILVFHLPYMKWFMDHGFEVHVIARNDTDMKVSDIPYCDCYFDIPFERSPFSIKNRDVYQQIKKIIDFEQYDLIHCNTPVGGMITRLAAKKARKKGTKVVYTAHGFHFFKGAPWINWALFYPVEWFLSRFTDLIITINQEDYGYAQHLMAKQVAMVNGVGIDVDRFDQITDRAQTRGKLGLSIDAPVVITVGEHTKRKNHQVILQAVAKLYGVHVLFCGVGEKEEELKALSKQLGMEERAHFLGFCDQVPALLQASDVFVFPSLQEGLPVAQMEAMAAGLPCVVSNVRGNADLISNGQGGYLCAPDDVSAFAEAIAMLLDNEALRADMGARNRAWIGEYSLTAVLEQMSALYRKLLGEV